MNETASSTQSSPIDHSAEASEVDQGAGAESAADAGVAASTAKPADQWVTGDEPATGAQLSYLGTLAREAGEPVPENLTKARASELIDQYRQESPRIQH